MYDEPYLETCCRAALHRLALAGPAGRPTGQMAGLKDDRCLARLAGMGLARAEADGRVRLTAEGTARHAREVLRAAG
jgi:hypothetical protein